MNTITDHTEYSIAVSIYKELTDEDIVILKETAFEDLIQFHHTVGRNIRNKYKLWEVETMTDKIHYKEIMWATRQLDCYAGENCDEEKPYWYVYADGDMDGDRESSPTIGIDLRVLPRGVKVVVSVPICPKCGLDIECCEIDKSCDFDWHNWEVGKYA